MSYIHSEGKGDFAQGFNKSYVSTKAFDGEFYTYTASVNGSFQNVGTFTAVTGANSTTCPANRVLHFTGRKIVPGLNPMTTFVAGAPLQTAKTLVAVYDPVSFLNGFIDPSSNAFAKYDQNMPNFFDLGVNGTVPPLGGQGGKLNIGPVATAGGDVGIASIGRTATVGNSVTISSGAYNSTFSQVFVTPTVIGITSVSAAATGVLGNSTFTISTVGTATTGTVQWMVVN